MLGGHGEEGLLRGVNAFAPQSELPIGEGAIELVDICVLDNDSPIANARLTPANVLVFIGRPYIDIQTYQYITDMKVQST